MKNALSGEVLAEGILIENDLGNNLINQAQPKLFRLIDNQIIRFQVE